MNNEVRPLRLMDRLVAWAFLAATVAMAGATVLDLAGLEWKWLFSVSGSFLILCAAFILLCLARHEEWEPIPLRLRDWIVRIPGVLVATFFLWVGVWQWTR